ncbi:MAG: hypothetical protein CMH49_10155 [Myxococcales bacterium]|nr:hypothetical protein [Myxococcales bacterium]
MMKSKSGGLSSLSDEQLKAVLRRVYSKELPCPFKRSDLLLRGLNAVAEEGDLLFGLDELGVKAVITAVISERRSVQQKLKIYGKHQQ